MSDRRFFATATKGPDCGRGMRDATDAERAAYLAQPRRCPGYPLSALLVGDMLIDEDTGPGLWFGGAGF